jgi:hypothetical protein
MEAETAARPALDRGLVQISTATPIWERFFTVAPLVLIGTQEEDGYDIAPKNLAMPLGWKKRRAQLRRFGILAVELTKLEYFVRRVRGSGVGDHLYARPAERAPRAPFQLVIGHMDTVWPVGRLTRMPIRREKAARCSVPGTTT